MKKALLLKKIEDVRHELYNLSQTSELNSELMIERSKELDELLNLYDENYTNKSPTNRHKKY